MSAINTVMWAIATILLVGCGLYFTIKLRFPQFNVEKIFFSLKKEKSDKDSISPFKTLTLALAARIGVGSLAGIALGIYQGGIGVIFWIWLSCLITLPNSFVESSLAVMFREKDGKYYAVGGTKGYRWMESELVQNLKLEDEIDISYYERLADDAAAAIEEYGDFAAFAS